MAKPFRKLDQIVGDKDYGPSGTAMVQIDAIQCG
jgi:hypothetical protein